MNKFKVLLVNPPVLGVLEPWYDRPDFCRTGLAYLAGYLRQFNEYEIKIIDAKFQRLDFQQVLELAKRFKPDLVGFTAFTNEIKPAAYQAALIKKHCSNTKTVIGGAHITALPKYTLEEFKSFDLGVFGDGEVTLHELCEVLRAGYSFDDIQGLVYRNATEVIQNAPRQRIIDQDSLPLPAWDMLPKAKIYFIQSIRGCPFNCVFCMNHNGRVARMRTVDNVIKEIEWILREFEPERISFGDELFTVDMERAHLLLDAMIEHRIGERVTWDMQSHVRYLDRPLLEKLKRSKIEMMELGVETGDVDMLKAMGKGTNLESIIKAFRMARDVGVPTGALLLLGQPNETIESINRTIDLAIKINPDVPLLGIMIPFPGTEVAKMAAEGKGGYLMLSRDWDDFNKHPGSALEFVNLSRNRIEWMQLIGYVKIFFFNWRFLDLLKFAFKYRGAAFSTLRKAWSKNVSIKWMRTIPPDYEEVIGSKMKISDEEMISSRQEWKKIQTQELKRAKRENPAVVKTKTPV